METEFDRDPAQSTTPYGFGVDPMAPAPVEPEVALGVVTAMQRGPTEDIDQARAALVTRWLGDVSVGKAKLKEKQFKRMMEDLDFLGGDQWGDGADTENYVANIVQRHIAQRTAALYAKNPRVKVSRRPSLDFEQWDGSMTAVQAIMQGMQQAQLTTTPPPPELISQMEDIMRGSQRRVMLDKVARTLEIIYDYEVKHQTPPFKRQMKQLVRRALGTGVGYVKLGYRRALELRAEDKERVTDATERLAMIQRITADAQDEEIAAWAPEIEELKQQIELLQSSEEPVDEGLTFDFPKATAIIVDPKCTHLGTFTGAKWIAHEFMLSREDIQEIYGIDVATSASSATSYEAHADSVTLAEHMKQRGESDPKKGNCYCVWEVWDKTTRTVFTILEGHNDYLRAPAPPSVNIRRFWTIFPLSFNEQENDKDIFPISDVRLLRPMQKEYNRSREGLRQHRIANRPKSVVPRGMLDEDDINQLKTHPANAVIQLNGVTPGQKVNELIQTLNGPEIRQELYDTAPVFEDVLRVAGSQEANLGGTAGGTATESSIAEGSRMSSLSSNVDDLEDMLTELAQSSAEILFAMTSPERAKQIAGVGAVWPEMSAQEIHDQLYVEIEAGSSGRPNKALDVQNFQQIAPTLIQIPGISPEWLAKEAIKRLDDRLDPADAIIATLPSIVQMNAQKQIATGDPTTSPEQQGNAGSANAPTGPGPAVTQGPPTSAPQTLV